MRNTDFEIPYLKQQAAKEQQQLADLERKHTEHLHSAMQAARQYQQVSDNAHMPLSDASGPRCVCRLRGCMFLWGLLALMCAQMVLRFNKYLTSIHPMACMHGVV